VSTRFANVTVAASNAVEAAPASQAIDGKRLSFADLRVDPLGKVPDETARIAGTNSTCATPVLKNPECKPPPD
jgi:hypothetical protein